MVIGGVFPYVPGISNLLGQGALGVNVFFALSGFLLTYSHLKDFSTGQPLTLRYYRNFMLKRIARIYPVFLAGLLLSLLGSLALHALPAHLPLLFWLNATMLNSWVPAFAMEWYGGGSWSVSTEMFFYVVFPFILPVLFRVESKRSLLVLLGVFIVLAATPGLLYNFTPGEMTKQGFQLNYSFPPARLCEFVAGMITGLLVLRFNWRVSTNVMLGLLAVASVYLVLCGHRLQGYTAHNLVVLPAIVGSVACLANSPQTPLLRWLGSSWAGYLGRISYSFYILQLVLLVIMDIVWKREMMPRGAWWMLPFLLIVNLLTAAVMYELVEKNMHKKFLEWFLPRKQQTPSVLEEARR